VFHVEQVKTGVTPLLNPSRLRPRRVTRDYNNGPPRVEYTHTHIRVHVRTYGTLTRRKKIHIR